MAITKGPLHGIRVLDLTQAHAGPFGTLLLGDLGAEIIKLEPPKGEMMRGGEKKMNTKHSYLIGLNRNKKGLVLDLKNKFGKQAFYDLVKKSDIVYSNYRADVPKRIGIDFKTLEKINPRIICCNISGYGETGPYTGYPSYDIIACGHSGILSISGESERAPLIPGGIALADMMGGIFGTMSVLAAMVNRDKTGKGLKVEINLLDGLLVMQQVMLQQYLLSGIAPPMQGRKHSISPGYGIFDTKDGYITIAALDHKKVLTVMGIGDVLEDPKFNNPINLLVNKDALNEIFAETYLTKTTDEWIKLLRDENDIACGPVLNYDDILQDPQVLFNKMVIEMDLRGEKYKTIGSVFKLYDEQSESLVQGQPEAPADLGQHTAKILKEILNYSDDQIEAVKEENEGTDFKRRTVSDIKMVYEHEVEEAVKNNNNN